MSNSKESALSDPARTGRLLLPLFTLARDKDEFEYACALVRLTSYEMAGWDPLVESNQFIENVMALAQAPLEPDARLRLGLVAYCHIIEMEAPCHMIANMAQIATGERYTCDPFGYGPRRLKKPSRHMRLERMRELLRAVGHEAVADHMSAFVSGAIRNAFAHSQYAIRDGSFNICRGRGMSIGNTITHRVPIEEEVLPRINGALAFWHGFYDHWVESRLAYKENKRVRARIAPDGGYEGIELMADETHGLYGFRGLESGS
ncbi:MAG: hypothetical protein HZC42_08595 [Candidatus Eisenbacteria bacterium]|nr:hypothetical protein [Candidatus Eisenbacteria bacterium]